MPYFVFRVYFWLLCGALSLFRAISADSVHHSLLCKALGLFLFLSIIILRALHLTLFKVISVALAHCFFTL